MAVLTFQPSYLFLNGTSFDVPIDPLSLNIKIDGLAPPNPGAHVHFLCWRDRVRYNGKNDVYYFRQEIVYISLPSDEKCVATRF
jgi:hypothetical protein